MCVFHKLFNFHVITRLTAHSRANGSQFVCDYKNYLLLKVDKYLKTS